LLGTEKKPGALTTHDPDAISIFLSPSTLIRIIISLGREVVDYEVVPSQIKNDSSVPADKIL